MLTLNQILGSSKQRTKSIAACHPRTNKQQHIYDESPRRAVHRFGNSLISALKYHPQNCRPPTQDWQHNYKRNDKRAEHDAERMDDERAQDGVRSGVDWSDAAGWRVIAC
jgi:hypothetical protein